MMLQVLITRRIRYRCIVFHTHTHTHHVLMESSWSSLKSSLRLLLLLSVTIAVMCEDAILDRGNNIELASCPANCTCSQSKNQGPSLAIDCISRTGQATNLSEEIDAFLSDRVHDLVNLVLTRTPLTSLPISVCQLAHMQNLTIDNNKLRSLPVDCINKMSELQFFSASNNELVEIQVNTKIWHGVQKSFSFFCTF
jgi:hypothetical protein